MFRTKINTHSDAECTHPTKYFNGECQPVSLRRWHYICAECLFEGTHSFPHDGVEPKIELLRFAVALDRKKPGAGTDWLAFRKRLNERTNP